MIQDTRCRIRYECYIRSAVRYNTTSAWAEYDDIFSDGVETPSGMRWLHTAGQMAYRADGSVPETFAAQCEQALKNVVAVLEAARMTSGDIVKLTCFVVGPQDLELLYSARRRLLPQTAPAATAIFVQALGRPEFLVEIEAVAAAIDPAS